MRGRADKRAIFFHCLCYDNQLWMDPALAARFAADVRGRCPSVPPAPGAFRRRLADAPS